MKIYYINSEEFLKKYDINFLQQYTEGIEFKSFKRFIQYSIGRFLVKSAGERDYNILDSAIVIKNGKPEFKYSDIKFSITHCEKYIAAAFDQYECGLDIEKIKKRNLTEISQYYKKEFKSLEEFYRFWTEYEAEIKLQQKIGGKYTEVFQNHYMLTVVSTNSVFIKPESISLFET